MDQNMRPGQFYRDTINKDLLKVLGFTFEVGDLSVTRGGDPLPWVEYVRCACIANDTLFGVQEMKTSTLEGVRFIRVNFFAELWLKWKWRNSRLRSGDVPQSGDKSTLDQKSTY